MSGTGKYTVMAFGMALTGLLCAARQVAAQDSNAPASPADSAAVNHTADSIKKALPKLTYAPVVRLNIDALKLIMGAFNKSSRVLEFALDYSLKNNNFLELEGGYGYGKIDNSVLKFSSNSFFVRGGIDKAMVGPSGPADEDLVFIGARVGVASGKLNDGTYVLYNPFGGTTAASFSGKNFLSVWGEIDAGLKVQITSHIYAGWTGRAKFMLRSGFKNDEASPNIIAGYGGGDKSTAFEANLYIGWGFKWGSRK